MLTRLSSGISIAILVAGAAVAVDAAPASACNGTGCANVHLGYTKTLPGRSARPGGGGGAARQGPPPCPANTNCNTLGLGAAVPAAPVRTIDVAYDAHNKLLLPVPHPRTSPRNRSYVQLRTGLWLAPGEFVRVTAPASAGGQTVTAIAEPKDVTWNMGKDTVVCDTGGSTRGTACGYTYKRSSAGLPNGKYAISVTITWNVSWTCGGVGCDAENGTYPDPTMSTTTNTTLAVGEVQTQSRPG
jgi:hypothetical protein